MKPATIRKKEWACRLNEEEKYMKDTVLTYRGHGFLSDLFRDSLRTEFKRLEKEKIIKK